MFMYHSPRTFGTWGGYGGERHAFMAALVSYPLTFGDTEGYRAFAGLVMAHEAGHCFGLHHRCVEWTSPVVWADACSTPMPVGQPIPYQIPCVVLLPVADTPTPGTATTQDRENLMFHGEDSQSRKDMWKGDIDLLQAAAMRALPAKEGNANSCNWSAEE